MKFREHKGSLEDSMKTLVELPDRKALIEHCRNLLQPFEINFPDEAVKLSYYCGQDNRIGWKRTYIVSIDGYGVIGMTDRYDTLHWYVCHGCGWEAWIKDGIRNAQGCGNPTCQAPNLHIHSNVDGELPKKLEVEQ